MALSKIMVLNYLYHYLIDNTSLVQLQRQRSFTRGAEEIRIVWADLIIVGLNVFDADQFENVHALLALIYLVETITKTR